MPPQHTKPNHTIVTLFMKNLKTARAETVLNGLKQDADVGLKWMYPKYSRKIFSGFRIFLAKKLQISFYIFCTASNKSAV